MIRYFYTDDYDAYNVQVEECPSFDGSYVLMFNVKMYVAGDKYDIPGLRALATKKFQDCVKDYWNSKAFSEAALYLWEDTVESDRELRDVFIASANQNIDALLDRGEFTNLMKMHGDFCCDIVKAMRGHSLEFVCEPEPKPKPQPQPIIEAEEDFGWGPTLKSKKKKGKSLNY